MDLDPLGPRDGRNGLAPFGREWRVEPRSELLAATIRLPRFEGPEHGHPDPAWHGNYTNSPPLPIVQALEQMNMTTPSYYGRTHPPEKFAADYAEYAGIGIAPFDAKDWLYQLRAMIHLDVANGGALDDAAKRVRAKLLVVISAQILNLPWTLRHWSVPRRSCLTPNVAISRRSVKQRN